jgi:hypothetical protein
MLLKISSLERQPYEKEKFGINLRSYCEYESINRFLWLVHTGDLPFGRSGNSLVRWQSLVKSEPWARG